MEWTIRLKRRPEASARIEASLVLVRYCPTVRHRGTVDKLTASFHSSIYVFKQECLRHILMYSDTPDGMVLSTTLPSFQQCHRICLTLSYWF